MAFHVQTGFGAETESYLFRAESGPCFYGWEQFSSLCCFVLLPENEK